MVVVVVVRTAHLSCIVVWMCLFMYACMCICSEMRIMYWDSFVF